ncbi:MAG: 4Fe-4S binding protein [Desulfobacterota bacterium]|nr:4Fe-4S binding protein [Thermodesulfobacteriota bacterium]
MSQKNVYERLAEHLSRLGMGYPFRDELIAILKENFSAQEAEVALAIPTRPVPLEPVAVDEIRKSIDLPSEKLSEILENLSRRGLLFSGRTETGDKGYALQQVGFGFPQTFFWRNEDTPHARKMAAMTAKYFSRTVTQEAFSGPATKPYRYIPVGRTLPTSKQAIFPSQMMETVIEKAEVIAVAHCGCRVAYRLAGKGCDHPTEVCMKYNDMARYVIDKGFAREISKQEALELIRKSEEEGLVHFVDNAEGEIQHNCNCCGCACWNVGAIRRRKIPRDALMATYFMRGTNQDACTGCGACVEICPVEALRLEGDFPVVAEAWCIGCGVCATVCPADAVVIKVREDKKGTSPASNFTELHRTIRKEKGLE